MTKKICLQKIIDDFITEIKKLDDIERTILDRNASNSFFISNKDVHRMRARQSVITEIFSYITDMLFQEENTIPQLEHWLIQQTTKSKITKRMSEISEEDAGKILANFLTKTTPIVEGKIIERSETLEKSADMTDYDQKRSALKEHSLSDKWIFNWLAMLVKRIREGLGLKTSSEQLLEESRDAANSISKSPL